MVYTGSIRYSLAYHQHHHQQQQYCVIIGFVITTDEEVVDNNLNRDKVETEERTMMMTKMGRKRRKSR